LPHHLRGWRRDAEPPIGHCNDLLVRRTTRENVRVGREIVQLALSAADCERQIIQPILKYRRGKPRLIAELQDYIWVLRRELFLLRRGQSGVS
jgi:hypothetical protein